VSYKIHNTVQTKPVLIDIKEVSFSCRARIKSVNRSKEIGNSWIYNLSLVIKNNSTLYNILKRVAIIMPKLKDMNNVEIPKMNTVAKSPKNNIQV
jgi:hypothetical protein